MTGRQVYRVPSRWGVPTVAAAALAFAGTFAGVFLAFGDPAAIILLPVFVVVCALFAALLYVALDFALGRTVVDDGTLTIAHLWRAPRAFRPAEILWVGVRSRVTSDGAASWIAVIGVGPTFGRTRKLPGFVPGLLGTKRERRRLTQSLEPLVAWHTEALRAGGT
ncbi:hypothetical protein [Microbacterium sp.]|uniref:hypothetical protein n=1 Tax=Microbacterium sp. TaxID=51671 RepID=UPI003A8B9E80